MYRHLVTGLLVATSHIVNALPAGLLSRQASNSSIQWMPCTENSTTPRLQCAKLEVPLDWANPGGETITLFLSRLRASGNATRLGSVTFNPGGPGGAASPLCAAAAEGYPIFTTNLTSHYDVLCPDPRGVGMSSPVRCDPDIWNTRQSIFPKDNASYELMTEHYKAFGESCLNLTGDLVKYVDTASVAHDFEAIRAALGEGKLNYLGVSYGSQIGTTYAELFPQNVGRMALDGILDHTTSKTYFVATESETYENVLDRFFDYCNQTESCPLHGQNVSEIFDNLVREADITPIPAPDCATTSNSTTAGTCFANVTGEDIRFNAHGYLTFRDGVERLGRPGWDLLGQVLSDAANGNASLLSTPLALSENSSNWQGLVIGCLDWHRFSNFADNLYKQQLTNSTSPHTQGASGAYSFEAQCAGWPLPATNPPAPLNETAMALAPPILLVNAYYDPSTSYTWAQSIKEQVPNGVLLTRNGDGHTSYFLQGEATTVIDTFLIDGTLPADNTVVQT